jgi:hypothetical protein
MLMIAAITWQSCDSKLTIESPYEDYFVKYIGTEGFQTGVDLAVDSNGDIYLLGTSAATLRGERKVYVARTNSRGEVIWAKKIDSDGDEDARDIEVTSDGNIAIVANRTSPTLEKDFIIYLLSATDGSFARPPVTGGYPSTPDYANSITETSDGFIVSSYSEISGPSGIYRDASVFRYNRDLLIFGTSWKVKFDLLTPGGAYDLVPVKVVQADANTFYTFCYTNAPIGLDNIPDYNFYVFVTGQQNNLIRNFLIPGLDPSHNEILTSVRAIPPQSGSGYVLAGYTSNPTSSVQDLYAVKLVQDLTTVTPSEPNTFLQSAPRAITSGISSIKTAQASIYPSSSAGFLLLGLRTTEGSDDVFLTKVDNLLNETWTRSQTFGGIGDDAPGAVMETSDGRILFCGTMVLGEVNGQQKIALIKLSPQGMFGE